MAAVPFTGRTMADVQVGQNFVQEAHQVLAGGNAADRTRQDIIEHQGGDGKLGERSAHGFFHDPVNAPSHEHAAAFDVDRAYGIRKQHDGEDEPGGGFAHGLLRDPARIVGRRGKIIQYDRRRSPEGNKGEHSGGRHHNPRQGRGVGARRRLCCRIIVHFWAVGWSARVKKS